MNFPPGFEWDLLKAQLNFEVHGVSFEEAATAFVDARSFTIEDVIHSLNEDRYVLIGRSYGGRILVVVHTDRGDNIRLISARLAEPSERRGYESGPA